MKLIYLVIWNMKKFTIPLCLLSTLFLTSCGSTQSYKPQILINGEAKEWIKWDCSDFVDSWKHILTVGYMPNDTSNGTIFIGDDVINATHSLEGLQHRWDWGNNKYALIIQSDGTGLSYNFSGASFGESVKASEVYKCSK